MSEFVKAGKHRINLDHVAYIKVTDKEIKAHFVGIPSPLTLPLKDAEALLKKSGGSHEKSGGVPGGPVIPNVNEALCQPSKNRGPR